MERERIYPFSFQLGDYLFAITHRDVAHRRSRGSIVDGFSGERASKLVVDPKTESYLMVIRLFKHLLSEMGMSS